MSRPPTDSTAARQYAFRTYVEPEIEVMLRVALTLTGSWADAEDLVQDTLVRAYCTIEGFDGAHPQAWLLTILRNTNVNSHRRQRPDLAPEITDLEGQRPVFGAAVAASPEQTVLDRVLDHNVKTALAALDPKFQTVLLLIDRSADLRRGGGPARCPGGHRDVAAVAGPRPSPHRPSFQPRTPEKPMMSSISTMLTCRWSARRIQRYLDADPAALLDPAEVQRLQAHLATCEKCAASVEEYRGVRRALIRWSQRRMPDPAIAARLRLTAERLKAEDAG